MCETNINIKCLSEILWQNQSNKPILKRCISLCYKYWNIGKKIKSLVTQPHLTTHNLPTYLLYNSHFITILQKRVSLAPWRHTLLLNTNFEKRHQLTRYINNSIIWNVYVTRWILLYSFSSSVWNKIDRYRIPQNFPKYIPHNVIELTKIHYS